MKNTKSFPLLLVLLLSILTLASAQDDKDREKATNITFNVMEKMEMDHDFTDQQLFSINERIYRDANRQSGYYYYYPTEYSLNWVPNRGGDSYDLNFNYGQDGKVTVTAVLKPKVSRKDLELFRKSLLKQATVGKPDACPTINGLLPLPLSDRPEIEFNNLSQFGISDEQVDVRPPADLKGQITMSFTTTNINSLINMLFNDVGLYGNVIITPDGKDMQNTIAIPFNLKIDDPATYGRQVLNSSFWREKGWINNTRYPVQLNYLHILKQEGSRHQVYTWNLGDVEILQGSGATFSNNNIIPAGWDTDSSVKRIWVDYTMQPCNSCNDALREEFMKGLDGEDRTKIKIRVQDVMEFTEADVVYVKLRSRQADPNGLRRVELEDIEISNDGESLTRGPLYVKTEEAINFEYMIVVVMPDGKIHKSTWKSHNENVLSIASTQIKKQIAHFRLKKGGEEISPEKKDSKYRRDNGTTGNNKYRRGNG